MRTHVIAALTISGLVATALPSLGATPKSTTLYFGNAVQCNATTAPQLVLDRAPTGTPCGTDKYVVQGQGLEIPDVYASTKKAAGFVLDGRKHITGTVYVAEVLPVSSSAVKAYYCPGPVAATVSIAVNGVDIGPVSGSGVVSNPSNAVPIAIDVAVPSRLNGQKVRSITATISFDQAVGFAGVQWHDAEVSKLVFGRR